MAPSFVTIDTNDMDMAPAQSHTGDKRTLLLAPPSIATHEEKLRDLFTTFDRTTTDLQMLDRLSAGYVFLPANTYNLVLILTDTDGKRRTEALQLLSRDVYTALVPAMKPGAKLQAQDRGFDATEAMEAVLAGLMQTDTAFEKPDYGEAAVPLRFNGKKKKTGPTGITALGIDINIDRNDDNDDELINEDSLLSEEDLSRPIIPRTILSLSLSSFHVILLLFYLLTNCSTRMPTQNRAKTPSLQRLQLRTRRPTGGRGYRASHESG